MPSRDERRRHYDAFVAHVRGLCRTPRIRSRLENGRGQPLTECPRMDAYLVKPCQGFGARRAHYTIASLIALERPVPDWTQTTPSSPAHRGLHLDDPLESESALLDGWSRRPNFGRTLADSARAHPHTAAGWQREVEVMGVLSADLLHTRLPHTIRRLLNLGLACDFAVLLEDLAQWDFDPLEVAGRWRHAFYLTVPDTLLEL
ncbi:type I-E CRISPR-associated protein Cse2/CasB [Streptomyces sp. NPDC005281]|uniref:type I-E CRISPR-associated protein Cse2/CasB n=1 Tax=Streptomyces sp. NPDC005281 TaxID=3155712 RepID=UPI0033A8EB19